MKSSPSSSSKLERKTLEKNRRMNMRSLCSELASLIPSHSSKRAPSVQDQLEQAANYIRKVRKNIELLKQKKGVLAGYNVTGIGKDVTDHGMAIGFRLPVVEVKDLGSTVEVVLIITGLTKNLMMLSDVITIIEEEGAQVVNATFSSAANKLFYIIHSQVTSSRVGFESARVHERLNELIGHWN